MRVGLGRTISDRTQVHAADGAIARPWLHNLRVHRARVQRGRGVDVLPIGFVLSHAVLHKAILDLFRCSKSTSLPFENGLSQSARQGATPGGNITDFG